MRGGVFAGGTPDVYVSNSFSNTGVLTNAIDIQQTSNASYNNAAGATILANVNGAVIPSAANTVVQSAALSGTAPTNALAPNFKLPRQLRTTLSTDWNPAELGVLGTGWSFGADFLYSRVIQQVDFTDIRIRANGLLTPDGRSRYTPVTNFADTNSDILLTNSQQGRSYVAVLRARKNFGFGLETGLSYTFSNVKDKNPATSSVATNGGTVFFSTDAVTANGNDNNTISNNNIGPAGANLPSKAILGNGSTTTTAINTATSRPPTRVFRINSGLIGPWLATASKRWASSIAGIVVTSSSSMTRGLVRAT